MALTRVQIEHAKEELDNCNNPLFFFDDDQDGLCSFLQLYRYKKEGRGIIVKTTPALSPIFLKKVHEYGPDRIFILDVANVDEEFLESAKAPIVWIDHHGTEQKKGVSYYNPRANDKDDNFPTSYLCYQIAQQDLWVATLGCVADWFIPDFIEDFKKEYGDLVEQPYKSAPDIIFNSRLGKLIRIFSFILKGDNREVMRCVKILTRIESPYEILDRLTPEGRLIYKRFEQTNKLYGPLLNDALKAAKSTKSKIIVFKYEDDKSSFTSDLSNEIIYNFPDKIVFICREKGEEVRCSLRSSKIIMPPLIEKCLVGLKGYGGGHEHACGLNVVKSDFEEFMRRFKEMV